MKTNTTIYKVLFAGLLIAGSVPMVIAQRDSRGGSQERGARTPTATEQRSTPIQRPDRGGFSRGNREPFQSRSQTPAVTERYSRPGNAGRSFREPDQSRVERRSVPEQVNRNNSFNRNNSNNWQRTNRVYSNRGYSNSYSNRGYNRSGYNRSGYNRSYNSSYNRYRYVPQRHLFFGAPRYSIIPRGSISIRFGGNPYYYNSGLFYNYYNGFYQPIFPPAGIRIGMLPFGYIPFYMGANRFYYYNGIYYRQYDDQNYEVVDAPMGAQVSSLPKGAKSVVVNGEKFYELNGTYYKADRDSKGREVFTVVGKNGEIDNTEYDDQTPGQAYKIGDVLSGLPEGSTPVTINGEQLFVTPDNSYLKQQGDENNAEYKVVGKAEEGNSSSQDMN